MRSARVVVLATRFCRTCGQDSTGAVRVLRSFHPDGSIASEVEVAMICTPRRHYTTFWT